MLFTGFFELFAKFLCVRFWPDAILDLSAANLVTYFLWPVVCIKWTGNYHRYWNSQWLQPLVCFSRCTGGDYFILFFPLLRKAVQIQLTNRCRPSPSYGSLLFISAFCLAHLILIRSHCSRANESTQLPAPPKKTRKKPCGITVLIFHQSPWQQTNKSDVCARRLLPIWRLGSSRLPLPVCIPFRTCKWARGGCVLCTSFAEAAGRRDGGRLLSPGWWCMEESERQ